MIIKIYFGPASTTHFVWTTLSRILCAAEPSIWSYFRTYQVQKGKHVFQWLCTLAHQKLDQGKSTSSPHSRKYRLSSINVQCLLIGAHLAARSRAEAACCWWAEGLALWPPSRRACGGQRCSLLSISPPSSAFDCTRTTWYRKQRRFWVHLAKLHNSWKISFFRYDKSGFALQITNDDLKWAVVW